MVYISFQSPEEFSRKSIPRSKKSVLTLLSSYSHSFAHSLGYMYPTTTVGKKQSIRIDIGIRYVSGSAFAVNPRVWKSVFPSLTVFHQKLLMLLLGNTRHTWRKWTSEKSGWQDIVVKSANTCVYPTDTQHTHQTLYIRYTRISWSLYIRWWEILENVYCYDCCCCVDHENKQLFRW